MDRRRFLLALGASATAGCAGRQATGNFASFRERLRADGVDVARISRDIRRWFLEYFPDRSSEAAFRAEVDAIALDYAATVPPDAGGSPHRLLECFLLRANRSRFDVYTIPADLARRHATGSVPEADYLRRVHASLDE